MTISHQDKKSMFCNLQETYIIAKLIYFKALLVKKYIFANDY